jgi:hypothetical protein
MNQQHNLDSAVEISASKPEYVAPAILSVVKVTDVVRGGTGFASDGGNFLPF